MVSESSAPIEKNENDSWTSNSDQRQGGEIGDQMDVDAHGSTALSEGEWTYRLRGSDPFMNHAPQPM